MPPPPDAPDSTPSSRFSPRLVTLLQASAVVLSVLAAYALIWRDWGRFVRAIDHTNWLFNDFRFHFYPMAEQIMEADRPVPGYFYSAFFALLIRPLAWLPLESAALIWGKIQVLTFAALCLLPLARMIRLPRRGLLLYLLLCMTSYPALNNFKWGQVSFLLTLLAVASLEVSSRNRSILAGVLIALAASIKYYSGIFLLVFIFRKDWKACLSFAVGGALLFAVFPGIVMGPEDWMAFHRAALASLSNSDWIATDPNSQYFAHVAPRWLYFLFGRLTGPSFGLVAAGWTIVLVNFAFIWRARRTSSPDASALSLALVFTATPFLVATSWPHYFVYLPFCQAAVLTGIFRRLRDSRTARLAWSAPVVVSIFLACVPFFLIFPTWRAFQEKGFLFLSNVLLLPPLYAWALMRPPEDENALEYPSDDSSTTAATA